MREGLRDDPDNDGKTRWERTRKGSERGLLKIDKSEYESLARTKTILGLLSHRSKKVQLSNLFNLNFKITDFLKLHGGLK